jgi:hypothetical protein
MTASLAQRLLYSSDAVEMFALALEVNDDVDQPH